ncbi:hypothetical protein H8711_04115 [Clostridiaceae bacterium NSJ-31]|uniref:Phage-related protein n=1 Tax=Ligaoa zhengdingensis TaxID=2763658 RepID=A0A926DZ41_9FIRM|nr:hypothetical protein [Ligaoa zhengdingensis]MBC8546119.1 hypothetical protein [Ligaoa zhengdingensis]
MDETADGAIVISTELDNKELEKELAHTKKKIDALKEKLNQKQNDMEPLTQEANQLRTKIREATDAAKQYGEQWKAGVLGADQQQAASLDKVSKLRSEYEAILKKMAPYDNALVKTATELERQEEKAARLSKNLAEASTGGVRIGDALDRASNYLDKFTQRIKGLARRVFVFTVITSALRAIRDWMSKVIKTNSEATATMARLKGALLTLAQPLVDVVVPAFTCLVNILTRLISVAAQLMARLFGKTGSESKKAASELYKETEALNAVGASAKDAEGALAGFDEINVLQQSDAGGGGASSSISPSFDFDTGISEDRLNNILMIVKMIGAALLAWKLSDSFGGGIKMFLGLLLAIDGVVGFVKSTFDAWVNGVSWENLMSMTGRMLELVAGLWIAFGKLGGGIGLVVSGIVMLVTAFHDADKNGWNLQNTMMAITGIIATGLGIALLVGSWIPLLIAGIAALLLAIVNAFGDGEALIEGFKTILGGFKDFFVGIFTGDIGLAISGAGKIFEGLGTVFNTVVDAIKNMFLSFLDWLNEKTNGKFSGIINIAKAIITGFFDYIKSIAGVWIDGIKQIFQGLITFFTGVFTGDWDMVWQGIKDIFGGIWNIIVGQLETAVNFIIKGVNWLIDQLNKIHFEFPDWVPGVGGKSFGINISHVREIQLPRLAEGAVIPANREFLAVLGDQKSGTNIEAPLETIEQALANVMDARGEQEIVIHFTGSMAALARVLKPELDRATARKGIKLVRGGAI